MKFVAYKQANHANSRVQDSLPEVWITEFITIEQEDKSKFPAEDGWKMVPESQFNKLFQQCNHVDVYKAWHDKKEEEKRLAYEAAQSKKGQ